MIKVLLCIRTDHDLRLVVLAGLICAFASILAVSLYSRNAGPGPGRAGLVTVAGLMAGAGIWSTHFIAMLAFRPGLPTGYAPLETLGSLAIAVVVSVLGFNLARSPRLKRPALAAGPVVGLGIALMHFTGMAGLRTQGVLSWDPVYVAASLVLGVVLATAALTTAARSTRPPAIALGAGLLTVGICALHFTAMAAATITPDPGLVVPGSSLSNLDLALIVAGVTIVGLSIMAAVFVVSRSRRIALRQLREAIASTPDGMAVFDRSDALVAWNARFIEFLGSDEGVAYGASRSALAGAARARIAEATGEDPAAAAESPLVERPDSPPSQEHRSLGGQWWRVQHRRTSQGAVSVFIDITEHKEAEERQAQLISDLQLTEGRLLEALDSAEEASRAKSEFLANMSHELRTPLNGVLGLAGALMRRVRDPESQEMITLIEDSGRTLERVLSDILDLSKIEARKVSIETRDFDLVREVHVAVMPFAAKAQEKGVAFTVEMAGLDALRVASDALRIRQILSNLVSNAVKFTEQGEVRVTVRIVDSAPGYLASFVVQGTGVGFQPSQVERLFQAFEQDDASTTRRFGGTGLGLPICKGLADLLGGSLTATSTPGAGSAFTLVLPLQPPVSQAEAADEIAPADVAPNLRVLLAEDHAINRRVVELLLAPFGVELVTVEHGAAALEALQQSDFDLVLMDMQMPVMDGLEATREIRRRESARGRPPVAIAMLTANVSKEFVALSLDAGADHHISKPLTLDSLVGGIETCLAIAAAPQEQRGAA